MSETLGSLIDKLIVVKLKAYHTKRDDNIRCEILSSQERQLRTEINEYVTGAISGKIPQDRLTFELNKVHTGLTVPTIPVVSIAGSIAALADVNIDIWHLQEKMYNFAAVPEGKKNFIIRSISMFNVQRSNCIDDINRQFKELIK
jgi:hypothetical protein